MTKMMEMDLTTQSVNAIASSTLTGQHACHVPCGVSLAVIVDLGNFILLKTLVMRAQKCLLCHYMLHLITLTPAWIAVTVCASHVTRIYEK